MIVTTTVTVAVTVTVTVAVTVTVIVTATVTAITTMNVPALLLAADRTSQMSGVRVEGARVGLGLAADLEARPGRESSVIICLHRNPQRLPSLGQRRRPSVTTSRSPRRATRRRLAESGRRQVHHHRPRLQPHLTHQGPQGLSHLPRVLLEPKLRRIQ